MNMKPRFTLLVSHTHQALERENHAAELTPGRRDSGIAPPR